MYQNFRGFDIRRVLYVYINREIQGMPVFESFKALINISNKNVL